jgi:type I restriction enzyme S subunit
MAGVPMAMNQSCYAIKGKNFNQLFVFLMIKDITQKLLQQAHGTVFETITTQTFQRTMAIKPTIDVVDLFYKKVKPLYGLILDGMKNSEMLCDVRDSLLRKLMSGLVKIEN